MKDEQSEALIAQPDWLNMTTDQVAEYAARRSMQAISRTGTHAAEMRVMARDIADLEIEVMRLKQLLALVQTLCEALVAERIEG